MNSFDCNGLQVIIKNNLRAQLKKLPISSKERDLLYKQTMSSFFKNFNSWFKKEMKLK